MKNLILLVAFALVFQFVKGAHHLVPEGSVTCNNDHTVNIDITNVADLGEWNTTEWRLNSSDQCAPTFGDGTVNYANLPLPTCSFSSEQLNDSIKYVLKVIAEKTSGGANGQLRAYDHLYYVTCEYNNQNTSTASFVPIKNRNDSVSSTAFFTFTLGVFSDAAFNTAVSSPVALNQTLHFKAEVVTQSGAPNLDLFPVECYSSKSDNPDSTFAETMLRVKTCTTHCPIAVQTTPRRKPSQSGRLGTSEPTRAPSFTSTAISGFAWQTTRILGVNALLSLNVTLPRENGVSVGDIVDEEQVYHVVRGPYFYKEEEEEEAEEEEAESDEQDEPQSFSTNLTIIVAVSGVVAIAMMVWRNRLSCHAQSQQAQATRRSECGHLSARLEGAV
ncbi:hypothetical protein OS493_039004 [Desmophyllum pertusum]|uniref:ZP domain-containing protein n=1 Tax=Desmophyllum pertusum TaxID=174260 RepID=A0A9W9YU06_9CNID|nr:hypothetical protein OS493_039004 [Desmophyllum pertusum]